MKKKLSAKKKWNKPEIIRLPFSHTLGGDSGSPGETIGTYELS